MSRCRCVDYSRSIKHGRLSDRLFIFYKKTFIDKIKPVKCYNQWACDLAMIKLCCLLLLFINVHVLYDMLWILILLQWFQLLSPCSKITLEMWLYAAIGILISLVIVHKLIISKALLSAAIFPVVGTIQVPFKMILVCIVLWMISTYRSFHYVVWLDPWHA